MRIAAKRLAEGSNKLGQKRGFNKVSNDMKVAS